VVVHEGIQVFGIEYFAGGDYPAAFDSKTIFDGYQVMLAG